MTWEENIPASFTVKSPKICGQMPRKTAFLPSENEVLFKIYKNNRYLQNTLQRKYLNYPLNKRAIRWLVVNLSQQGIH